MRKLPVKRERPDKPDAAYYVGIWRNARRYKVDMARKRWCDLSHQHLDWDGFGNTSWRDRRRHLAALLHAFRRAQVELASFSGEYQLFVSVTPDDSGNDAVYIHTPNPNQTPFPMVPLGERVSNLPSLLAGRIDKERYEVFRYGSGASATYTIIAA
jgi:hypothetical protein